MKGVERGLRAVWHAEARKRSVTAIFVTFTSESGLDGFVAPISYKGTCAK